jgi:hypothetical protein
MYDDSVLERFWVKVDKQLGEDACWLWTSAIDGGYYGRFRINGVVVKAHRMSYEIANGAIPEDPNDFDGTFHVLHKCDTTYCVNPKHLTLGTRSDNQRDRVRKGRHNQREKSECYRGHPFTVENTYYYSDGRRQCKLCRRDYMRKYRS